MENICFIIAHRYYRAYTSYIAHYVNNIQKFYKDSFVIIVDNNSTYIDDIKELLKDYNNIVIIDNETLCKFEIGAYKRGIQYMIDNDLLMKYEYVVFSQDNFVLKNKLEFSGLLKYDVRACSFVTRPRHREHYDKEEVKTMFSKTGVSLDTPTVDLCWCNSFILHRSNLIKFLEIVKDLVITVRLQSEYSERYLSAILYHLNNRCASSLYTHVTYDCWTIDIINTRVRHYFIKRLQQKNENTPDK